MKKILIALSLVCLALCVSAEPAARIRSILDFDKQLEMTPDQHRTIKKALQEYALVAKPLAAELARAEDELKVAVPRTPLEKVQPLFHKVFELREKIAWNEFQSARKIETSLSANQLASWKLIQSSQASSTH